ncbi:MAG: transposase [Bacteroidales bacterium]|nr:transposase [Bacteroidales bacterium]
MLQNKDIKNLSELKIAFVREHKKPEFFIKFIEVLKIGKYHAIFSSAKQKGISSLLLIKILISFSFIDQKSVHGFTLSYWNRFAGFGKDAYYRLKNNPMVNWRGFLIGVAKQVSGTVNERFVEANAKTSAIKAFVFDDTPISKTGHAIEGVSKVWNHVVNRSILGYQLLVMGLYDGSMFIPVDFSFHREKGKNKKKPFGLKPKQYKKQYKKKRAKGTFGVERKKELDTTKIASVVKMIKHAVKKGITADYVLTDSWFACWALIETSLANGLGFIGMFSKVKTLFTYNNKTLTYKEIRRANKKNIKRSKRFNLYYIRTVVGWKGQKVVLCFTRRGKRGNWKTIICTDLKLDFNDTIEIYQLRWSIEVFFKESKQMLGLGKSQSNDFDAQIADTTISLVRYISLALHNSIEKYESLGKLFEGTKADVVELRLQERLVALLVAIIDVFAILLEQWDEQELLKKIINDEQAFEKINLLINQKQNVTTAA